MSRYQGSTDGTCSTCGERRQPADRFCEKCGQAVDGGQRAMRSGDEPPHRFEFDLGVVAGVRDHRGGAGPRRYAAGAAWAGPRATPCVVAALSATSAGTDGGAEAASDAVRRAVAGLPAPVRSGADAVQLAQDMRSVVDQAAAGFAGRDSAAGDHGFVAAFVNELGLTLAWSGAGEAWWLPARISGDTGPAPQVLTGTEAEIADGIGTTTMLPRESGFLVLRARATGPLETWLPAGIERVPCWPYRIARHLVPPSTGETGRPDTAVMVVSWSQPARRPGREG